MEKPWTIAPELKIFKKESQTDNEGSGDRFYWSLEYKAEPVASSHIGFETEQEAKDAAKQAKHIFSLTVDADFN